MTPILYDSWGKERGNFNPEQDPAMFLDLIKDNKGKYEISLFFAPRCNFTTRIVALGEEDDSPDKANVWFVRSKQAADGGIVAEPGQAVMIFNADCPIVALFDEERERLAVLHAGFRCLIPAPRKGADTRSIIQVAFDDHHFKPNEVSVFVGYGIGSCCYGAEHWPELAVTSGADVPIGRAIRGPRAGQRSINLFVLAINQLVKVGVPISRIKADYECTACVKDADDYRYHSNARSGGTPSRNASFAWFTR